MLSLSPPIPPQPPQFSTNALQDLVDVKSELNRSAEILSLLQTQVDSLNGLARTAETRIMEYQSYVELLHSRAFSFKRSINHLPAELMGIIFELCCSKFEDTDPCTLSPKFDRTPWILSSVSRTWRQLALTTPIIWLTIPGPIELSDPMSGGAKLVRLRRTLARCTRPRLQVFLRSTHHYYMGSENYFSILEPYFSRIRSLNLYCSLPGGMKEFPTVTSDAPERKLSSLRSLCIKFASNLHHTSADLERFPPLFQEMPSLTHLTLRLDWGVNSYREIIIPSFPWNQLTSLTIDKEMDYVAMRKLLSLTERLEEFHATNVYYSGRDDALPASAGKLTLLSLRLLHLNSETSSLQNQLRDPSDDLGWIKVFLADLYLPNLESLSVQDAYLNPSVVADFLTFSQCALKHCEYTFYDPAALVLQHCASVTTLSLAFTTDSPLIKLGAAKKGVWLVPQLSKLVLVSPSISSGNVVEELIQSRRKSPDVQDLRTVEMEVRFVDLDQTGCETRSEADATDWRVPGGYHRRCMKHFSHLSRAKCGYELVNKFNCMDNKDHLKALCEAVEKMDYKPALHDPVLLQRGGLTSSLVKIYQYLTQIEDPKINQYRTRLHRALCRWTHDPWALEVPPPGWSRSNFAKPENSNVPGLLAYGTID